MSRSTELVAMFVGVMVMAVVGAGAALPIASDLVAGSGATGVTTVVLGLVPLIIALLMLVSLADPVMQKLK